MHRSALEALEQFETDIVECTGELEKQIVEPNVALDVALYAETFRCTPVLARFGIEDPPLKSSRTGLCIQRISAVLLDVCQKLNSFLVWNSATDAEQCCSMLKLEQSRGLAQSQSMSVHYFEAPSKATLAAVFDFQIYDLGQHQSTHSPVLALVPYALVHILPAFVAYILRLESHFLPVVVVVVLALLTSKEKLRLHLDAHGGPFASLVRLHSPDPDVL